MKVWVCVWDAVHTLERVEKQQEALQSGAIQQLIDLLGRDTPELAEAMERLGLLSRKETTRGPVCPTCDSLMDEVLSRPGIQDRVQAYRDVAEDFGGAVDRTRDARV